MKMRISSFLCILVILFAAKYAKAQDVEHDYQSRIKLDLSFKPVKKVKFTFSPELRFEDGFTLDKYLLEADVKYKATKLISLGASYGLVGNKRNEKDTEHLSRYSISAIVKKDIDRFEPSFRFMYSNYADDEIADKNYLRFKASLGYDIPKCKLTPFVAAQAFYQLNENELYKMRYALGADYKLFKDNYIQASYKLDYYQNEYKNRHIFTLGYKLKF